MDYIAAIERFIPSCAQEAADQNNILSHIRNNPHTVLTRDDPTAHITSSGFIFNAQLNKALLVHHNLRGVWAWTGGHADGDSNLLQVSLKEAQEETGVVHVRPLSDSIASLDILPVFGHWRKGVYVSAHLHLSIAYLLICNEAETTRPRLSENTALAWFDISAFTRQNFDAADVYLYNKLINKAKQLTGS